MKLVSGTLLWTKINTIPRQFPYLSKDIETELVILGAGITGALCAYYFAEAGIPCVVVDKNIVGYGSTSASTSILQYEIDTDLNQLQSSIGLDNATKCFKLCEGAVHEIESILSNLSDSCDYEKRDCLYYTNKGSDTAKLKKEYELRKAKGFSVEFLEKESASSKFSFPIKAGIYSSGNSGQIDPYRFTQALISHAEQKGAQIYENTEVAHIEYDDNGVLLSTTNGFKIKAKKAIIALGFKAKEFIPRKIVKLTRTFTVVSKAVKNFDGWYNECIIRDTNSPYTYLRTTKDNRIIIGGEDVSIGSGSSNMAQLYSDDKTSHQKYEILTERLKHMFPRIPDIKIEYCFNGLFGDTQDSLPYIGEHEEFPHCYFCLGYGANGILYAAFGAQMLRDLYLSKPTPDLQLFRFNR